jgi:hypothetical protein
VDTTAPLITLADENPMTIECHGSFTDPGATASDACAGDLTAEIHASGTVDPNAGSSYTLTYTVSDPSGNTTNSTRIVNVVDTTAPTFDGCTNQTAFQEQITTHAQTCITTVFNGIPIHAGHWVWFTAHLMPRATNSTYTINISGQTITGTIGGSNVSLTVPDAQITYSSAYSSANSSFVDGKWMTTCPLASKLAAHQFMSGLAYQLPFNSPGGGRLTWCGTFDVPPTVALNWKWAAAVYTNFSSEYDSLGIKPVDDHKASVYKNPDQAGTPENSKQFLIGGARGGGGANFTGGYSGTKVGNLSGTTVCSGGAVQYVQPSASDSCEGITTVDCKPQPGAGFNTGTTTITCTSTDQSGNTNTCSFTLTVQKPLPRITCPANISTNTTSSSCSQVVKWTCAAKSACGGTIKANCAPPSGSTFSKGANTVTCTATESAGNSATCSFSVTVNDATKPRITCPANTITNTCSDPVVNYSPKATDNCPGVTNSCAPPSGSTFTQGTNIVTCTATDASGNSSPNCSFKVIVTRTAASIPADPSANVGTGKVTMSWKTSTGSVPIIFNVKRATISGGPYTAIASGITTTSYTDTAVVTGTKYYYVISATNCVGESANSPQLSATPK